MGSLQLISYLPFKPKHSPKHVFALWEKRASFTLLIINQAVTPADDRRRWKPPVLIQQDVSPQNPHLTNWLIKQEIRSPLNCLLEWKKKNNQTKKYIQQITNYPEISKINGKKLLTFPGYLTYTSNQKSVFVTQRKWLHHL